MDIKLIRNGYTGTGTFKGISARGMSYLRIQTGDTSVTVQLEYVEELKQDLIKVDLIIED